MLSAEIPLLLLLLVAALVGMVALRLKLPYTVALVLAGIGLGFLHIEELSRLHLTPELLMAVFLPALLFEAAYHLQYREFERLSREILLLAVVGVLIAVGVTGGLVWLGLQAVGIHDFSLGHGFLFASMIAATDPISVLALFRSLGVPRRLYLLVEGESLLNDGVAVVVFLIVAAVLGIDTGHGHVPELHGTQEILVYGVRTFGWMGLGGVLVGSMVGALGSVLTSRVDDKLLETSLSVVVAYGSFLLAEYFDASGVLAVVASGMVFGSFGSRFGMSPRTRMAVVDFWEFMAFFSNTFVFLLVGLELDIPELVAALGLIALAFVAVLLARAATVYTLLPITRLMKVEPIPKGWGHVLVWGGLRGSLSMVLVMGLPQDMPGRRLLLVLVFGVVSVSLLLQALTMKPLLRRLGLVRQAQVRMAYETARGRVWMARAALRDLEERVDLLDPAIRVRFEERFKKMLSEGREQAIEAAGTYLDEERLDEAAMHMITVQEEALRHAIAEGVVSEDAAEVLFDELASERDELDAHDVGEQE